MNVLQSVTALLDNQEEIDPHLELDPATWETSPEVLGQRLIQDLPGQTLLAQDWKAELSSIKDPLEAGRVVKRWMLHRNETLEKAYATAENQEAETHLE